MSDNLTERQAKWFASVKASLERDTGRTLEDWAEIVKRDCPETKPRAQAAWLKAEHGLGINRAAQILDAAFPAPAGWDEPAALRAALWTNPEATAIMTAFEARINTLTEVTPTQRKGYSAFSRKVQFAAIKPHKISQVLLGLAIAPETDPRLMPAGKDGWSERLTAKLILTSPQDIDERLFELAVAAWARS